MSMMNLLGQIKNIYIKLLFFKLKCEVLSKINNVINMKNKEYMYINSVIIIFLLYYGCEEPITFSIAVAGIFLSPDYLLVLLCSSSEIFLFLSWFFHWKKKI